jgi:hypothetical protein
VRQTDRKGGTERRLLLAGIDGVIIKITNRHRRHLREGEGGEGGEEGMKTE